jgi:3-phosphoshikimate 1-carboxyvinyltransferase
MNNNQTLEMKREVRKLENRFELDIQLPGSKSITLRNYMLAALADGVSTIRYPGLCDDTSRMEEALRALGVKITKEDENTFLIHGNGGRFSTEEVSIHIGESGASTRMLLGLCLLRKGKTILDGHPSLRARPNKYLLDALAELGATITSTNDGYLPVEIIGSDTYKESVTMKGDKSSQYFTALFHIAPLLPKGLEIIVEGELVSKPYIDITINEMRKFGVYVENVNYERFIIKPQTYQPVNIAVEGDASAASYWSALATLHASKVTFKNLGKSTKQGDYHFVRICELLGATVEEGEDETTITGSQQANFRQLTEAIDMESMPDVAPTLMAMAPFIPGSTPIVGLSTLRIKECDRISAPVTELSKFGIKIEEGPDYVKINQLPNIDFNEYIEVATYQDHRMAMSLAVFGTKTGRMQVLNPVCVEKTYPLFWEDLAKIYHD